MSSTQNQSVIRQPIEPIQSKDDASSTKASNAITLQPLDAAGRATETLAEEANNPIDPVEDTNFTDRAKFFLLFLAISLCLLLMGLDINIVSTAVPSITDHFHTVADVGWYYTAYRLSSSSLQFLFGKLYKVHSTKTLFVVSLLIFAFGSVICAAAASSSMFVVGRAITGVGVAGGAAGFFDIVLHVVPKDKRPFYQGIFGAIEMSAGLVAPVLGGVVTERLSWRWCFWINLPVCGASLIGIITCLPKITKEGQRERMDWMAYLRQLDLPGTLCLVASLASLFVALNWAGIKYAWSDAKIIGLLCTSAILLVLFFVDQKHRGDDALLPMRIMKHRDVLGGFIFSVCLPSSLDVAEYYAPTYFQGVHGFTPTKSGYMMLPCLLGTLVAMFLQGAGTSKFGYYTPFMITASIIMAIGTGLLTTWNPTTPLIRLLFFFGIVGFGAGTGVLGPQNAAQSALPKSDASQGIAVMLFAQNFGPALFVSIAQAIFAGRLTANLDELAPMANVTRIENLGLSAVKEVLRNGGEHEAEEVALALSRSLSQTWSLSLALACFSIVGALIVRWRSVKDKEE